MELFSLTRTQQQAYVQLQPPEERFLRRAICRIEKSPNNSVQRDSSVDRGSESSLDRESESSADRESESKQKPAACCCCCQNRTTGGSTKRLTAEYLTDSFPRFGPAYRLDPDPFEAFKIQAWNNVKKNTPREESADILDTYLSAIKKIEKNAKNCYDKSILDGLEGSGFNLMMIFDGCFFLQSVIHILGGAELLGHPKKHPYFGSSVDDKVNARKIKAIFFVGNQIPRVVIHTLMKQSFFQGVIRKGIAKGTWKPPSELPKMVLYLLVVHDELKKSGTITSPGFFSKLMGRHDQLPHFRETPLDLLHALHCLVQGPGSDPLDSETEDTFDVEAGVEELDRNNKFPSAAELKQKGILLEKTNEGIREIHLGKKYLFFPCLYIPPFTLDDDTEPILMYLQSYEIQQKIGRGKREVNSYVRFMADLIRTQQDVRILESKRIVQVKEEQKHRLPEMLSKLASSEGIVFTQNLHLARAAIEGYSPLPKDLVSAALLFGLIQTIFTILQYFVPRGSS